jgi:hypothetical protein
MYDNEPTDAMLDDPLLRRQELNDRDDDLDGLDPDEVRADMGLDDDDD